MGMYHAATAAQFTKEANPCQKLCFEFNLEGLNNRRMVCKRVLGITSLMCFRLAMTFIEEQGVCVIYSPVLSCLPNSGIPLERDSSVFAMFKDAFGSLTLISMYYHEGSGERL